MQPSAVHIVPGDDWAGTVSAGLSPTTLADFALTEEEEEMTNEAIDKVG